MKQCSKCNVLKELEEFGEQKRNKDGLKGGCRACMTVVAKAWNEANKERVKANEANYLRSNPGKTSARCKKWYDANKDKRAEYAKANAGKKRAHAAKYRAAKLKRTPSWLTTEDWNKINHMYSLAAFMTKQTGIKHEVDHIVPLQGETISGLHHPDNLQILTKSENCSKGNRH